MPFFLTLLVRPSLLNLLKNRQTKTDGATYCLETAIVPSSQFWDIMRPHITQMSTVMEAAEVRIALLPETLDLEALSN